MKTTRCKVPIQKERSIKLFLLLLLACIYTNINAQQTNLKQWMYVPNRISFPASGAPTKVSLPPTATTGYNGNGIYRANGNIHFYVYGNKIYDGSNTLVDTLPLSPSINISEIAIVPFNKSNCNNQYYIFYTIFNTWGSCTNCHAWLYGAIVSTNTTTGAITITDICYPGTSTLKPLATSTSVFPNNGGAGIAVSRAVGTTLVNYGKRFLYFVSGSSVQKVVLVEPTAANNYTGVDTTLNVVDSISLPARYQTLEADLSPDGKMLAWGEYSYGPPPSNNVTDSNYYHVIFLDSATGNYAGQHRKLSAPTSDYLSMNTYFARGVEFSSDNQYLFINTGYSWTNKSQDGIYKIQISNWSKSYLSGSSGCSNSQLEMGANGKLYVVKGDTLKAIDPSTFAFQSSYDILVTAQQIYTNDGSYRTLPDQIDGENYDQYLWGKTDSAYIVNSNQTWTPAFWGRDSLILPAGIKVKAGATLSIYGMKLKFGANTSLELEAGASLWTVNSNLCANQTLCSGTAGMWQGIKARSNSSSSPITIHIEGNSDTAQGRYAMTIRDALFGAKVAGNYVNFGAGGVLFTGNEIDLRFDSMTLKNNSTSALHVGSCRFISDVALLDQGKGTSNGYFDGIKRTIASVWLQMIDSFSADFHTSTFQGGQYGIFSTKATFDLVDSELKGHKNSSIYATNSKDTVRSHNNNFHDTNNGIIAVGFQAGSYLIADGALDGSGNIPAKFSNIGQYAIKCQHNRQSNILIRLINYDNCGLAPIYFYDNGGYSAATSVPLASEKGNIINISANGFNNTSASKAGVLISEPYSSKRTYLSFRMNDNTVWGKLKTGFELTNIVGGNPITKNTSSGAGPVKMAYLADRYPVCDLRHNYVYLDLPVTWAKAYSLNASARMTVYNNNVNVISNENGTVGFNISNSPGTLLLANYTYMNYGRTAAELGGNMTYSNYDCNNFQYTGIGFLLNNNHILRTYLDNHGTLSTDARQNDIDFPSWGARIVYTGFLTPLNKWVFGNGRFTNKIKTPTLSGSIIAGYGTDNCPSSFPPAPPSGNYEAIDTLSDPVLNYWDQYYKRRTFLTGEGLSNTTNGDIVKIVQVEDYLSVDQFSNALTTLNSISSSNTIISDYKKVYSIFASIRLADTTLTNSQASILDTIAKKNAINMSPASNSARVILWNERQQDYRDTGEFIYPDIAGYIDSTCISRIGVPIKLLNNSGVTVAETTTDSTGSFLFDATTVSLYDNGQNYRVKASIPGYPDKYSSFATILNLAYSSNIVFGCSMASPSVYHDNSNSRIQNSSASIDQDGLSITQNLQKAFDNKISIYPNPAHEFVMIQCTQTENFVRVYNVLGETVFEDNIGQSVRIDTHNWRKGIYFVYISDNENNHVLEKVIIQ